MFIDEYVNGSQTARRNALVRRFYFPRASHKSEIQFSFIILPNNIVQV